MQLSNAGVHTSAGLRRHAAFKPCRPELRSRRRVVIRSDANKSGTLKLGSTPKAAGGLGGLLGTITRSIGTVSKAAAKKGPKDQRTVFLAGATGRLGARVLRELLAAGFKVRAGARNVDAAKADTDVAAQFGLITGDQLKNLSWVKLDLEEPDSIAAAIGNAGKVISAVGASEGSPLDSSAPRRIDGDGNIALIEAASASGVEQFVLVSSLGTGKIGFPAVVLNLFGGVLTQKRRAEEVLERSGLSYLIVRPGGMERPKDDYKLTHNLTVKRRDSTFGGQVSRLQVAELVTAAVVNPGLATNKCLELVAETTAPERSLEDLLDALPTEITKEQQEQLVVVEAQARKELESAKSALSAANEELAIAADKAAQLSDALKEAKAYEREVRGEVSGVLKEGAQAKKALEAAEAAAAKAAREEAAARAVLEAQKKAGAAGELLSAKQRQEIAKQALQPPKPKEDKPKEQQRAASPFGLFAAKPATPAPAAAAPAAPEKAPPRPASPFAGLFGGKKQEPAQEEEEEEEEEEVAEPVPARPSSPFAGFFGGLEPVAPKQQAPAPPAAAPKAAPAAAAAKPAPARQPAAPAKPEPARQPAAAAAKPEEPKKRSGSPFAGLFGGGATLQVGDDTKVQVPDRPAAQPAAKPAAAPAKPEAPAAPAAARAAPPQADAAAAAVAAEAKRKAALEEAKAKMQKEQEAAAAAAQKAAAAAAQKAAERERALKEEQENRERAAADAAAAAAAEADALARIKREREEEARKKADAKAKAEAEARAKAKADADAAGRALSKAKAEAEQRAVEEKQRAARAAEEQKKAAAAAATPKPAATTAGSSDVTSNVAEARAWIENWRSKPAEANNTTSKATPPAASPAAAPGGSAAGNGNSDVSPNVLEARQWIANWRAKQQGGNSSSSGAAANGQVIDAGEIFANVGRFFGGFGGQK